MRPSTDWSLDDVAAYLIQLEPGDGEELRALCAVVRHLAGRVPAGRAALEAACEPLERLAAGAADDPAFLLAEAGRLVGAALEEADAAGQPAPPPPPPEPAPAQAQAQGFLAALGADRELLAGFVVESVEYLEGAESALLALESDAGDAEAINTVFRAFHTIKGTSAFLGLDPISRLAHHAESLFDRFRSGEARCTGPRADLSLRAVDMLKTLLAGVTAASSGGAAELPAGYAELLGVLEDPAAAGLLGPEGEAPERAAPAPADALAAPEQPAAVEAPAAPPRAGAPEAADSSVRVRTDRLDQLINMVGELVIAQSMVGQDGAILGEPHSELARKVSHAGKIVRELQDLSVTLRMVPLKATFQRMARLVRDVARKSGKQVEFATEGEDTEIDRSMVDVIGDPLVHMIRNAVDHGIEAPEARAARGKHRTGRVRLAAFHAGGNVVVELRDDGKGLDREAIVRKALAKGLIQSDAALTDAEVFGLIFAPGFSTAEQVTDLSGRGVGMDVVKRSIESLRGRIEVTSAPGAGSTFTIRLPLTLAVTDGMLVRVGGERYIVPTVNIEMSFRPSREMLSTVARRGEMVLLRGELLPVVRLHRLMGIEGAEQDPTRALLAVVGFGERRCALLVDELLGQQQVVAKSLGEGLGRVRGVSGGAILGDGRVGLILDVSGIVALSRGSSDAGGAAVRLAS